MAINADSRVKPNFEHHKNWLKTVVCAPFRSLAYARREIKLKCGIPLRQGFQSILSKHKGWSPVYKAVIQVANDR